MTMAIRELINCAGTQFDPCLIEPFIYIIGKKYNIDTKVYDREIEHIEIL